MTKILLLKNNKGKALLLLTITIFCMFLNGCNTRTSIPDFTKESSFIDDSLDQNSDFSCTSTKELVKENQFYQLYREGFEYYYILYDIDGNIIKSDTVLKEPSISMVSCELGEVVINAGTGRGSQGEFYFDVNTGQISQSFYYVIAQKDQLLAYYDYEKIIVQNIFNENLFQKTINLSNEFADVEEPVISASFSDDMKSITVQYIAANANNPISETVYFSKTS